MNLIWIALAFGIATMIVGYVSSAERWERFVGSIQYGYVYTLGHAIFTALIFAALYYLVLLFGRWAWTLTVW
jgi:hydrogenase/urease accessory protein HupE